MNDKDYLASLQSIARIAKFKPDDKANLKRLYKGILLATQESYRANDGNCFYIFGGAVRVVNGHYLFYPDNQLKQLLANVDDTGTSIMLEYEENRFMDLIKRALAEIDGDPDDPEKRRVLIKRDNNGGSGDGPTN